MKATQVTKMEKTDDPKPLQGVNNIVVPNKGYARGWWHKVHMFSEGHRNGKNCQFLNHKKTTAFLISFLIIKFSCI